MKKLLFFLTAYIVSSYQLEAQPPDVPNYPLTCISNPYEPVLPSDVYTPKGTVVPTSRSRCELSVNDRKLLDAWATNTYPSATLIKSHTYDGISSTHYI